jgi:hypothetical protein
MRFELERVKQNIAEAETVELLDRITADRLGMEPLAVALIEDELARRGVTAEDVFAHAEHIERAAVHLLDGTAARCSICGRPAMTSGWGWHRLWGVLPLFPRQYYYCAAHRPVTSGT